MKNKALDRTLDLMTEVSSAMVQIRKNLNQLAELVSSINARVLDLERANDMRETREREQKERSNERE